MPRKKKYKLCSVCGIDNSNIRVFTTIINNQEMDLCRRHYYHYRTYGKELKRTRFTKNEIIEHENYLEMLLYDKEGKTAGSVIFAKIHKELLEEYKWYKLKDGKTFYAVAYAGQGMKRAVMHRLIATALYGECPEGKSVDHRNRNGLDNRDENLSYKDYCEQQWNQGTSVNNKTGYTGVGFDKTANLWKANIRVRGNKYSYAFKTKEAAIEKRRELELQRERGELG